MASTETDGAFLEPTALVGRRVETTWEWTPREVMLYALGVGAGRDPAAELELSTENSEGPPLRAIPSFGVLMTATVMEGIIAGLDPTMIVHAEQWLSVPAPLPLAGAAKIEAEVDGVYDKGSGALIVSKAVATDAASGEPLLEARTAVFLRGAGGFGGERGPSGDSSLPERSPDRTLSAEVRPDQALLYRLSGDRNPLHSDPAFATRAGFEAPILHGLATLGITARLLFAAYCDNDPERFGAIEVRFSAPVFPGETLRVETWREGEEVRFQTRNEQGAVVLGRGRLELRG